MVCSMVESITGSERVMYGELAGNTPRRTSSRKPASTIEVSGQVPPPFAIVMLLPSLGLPLGAMRLLYSHCPQWQPQRWQQHHYRERRWHLARNLDCRRWLSGTGTPGRVPGQFSVHHPFATGNRFDHRTDHQWQSILVSL